MSTKVISCCVPFFCKRENGAKCFQLHRAKMIGKPLFAISEAFSSVTTLIS